MSLKVGFIHNFQSLHILLDTLEKDPDGNKWADISKKTKKRKANALVGILKETGKLRDTINYRVTPDSVIIAAAQDYGKYLQFGTKYMPARPFLGISDADRTEIAQILRDYLL